MALVAFGLWIAGASLLEMHANREQDDTNKIDESGQRSLCTTMLLILGSSPMVEGDPSLFLPLVSVPSCSSAMSVVFAVPQIAAYFAMCGGAHAPLEGVSFGPLERYGEVLSGAIIAIVGLLFLVWSVRLVPGRP